MSFGFLFDLGFHVVGHSRYRLGESWTVGDDVVGVRLDSDSDGGPRVSAMFVRLRGGLVPDDWWQRHRPLPTMDVADVAAVLAPETLTGRSALLPVRREADRLPHLEFWAGVVQVVAAPWLRGDRDWYDRTERLVP